MNEKLLNPLDFYHTEGGEQHSQYAQQLFDRLLEESGIDLNANRAAVQAYEAQTARCADLDKHRSLYILGGVGSLSGILLGIACLALWETSTLYIPAGIFQILMGSALICGKVLPGCKSLRQQLREAKEQTQQLLDRASEQLDPLDRLFTQQDAIRLAAQTVPGLSFLERFTKEHLALLRCYDFREHTDAFSSVCNTLAGTFNSNPFLFTSVLSYFMVSVTDRGSKTIYWQEEERQYVSKTRTVTDNDGNEKTEIFYEWETVTVEKSQVLTAEHTSVQPVYTTRTTLGYGHHAAPDLSFSRSAGHAEKLSERGLQSRIRNGERKLQRKSNRALRSDQNFTAMANEKFDVLFGASDRNNEQQFLRLFTPVAQENMVALLTDTTLCGDAFSFCKDRRYNTISCADSVLQPSPLHYHDYSADRARERFLSYQRDYFKSLFGCFAPLLSIPAYQEPPRAGLHYRAEGDGHFPLYEREAIANAFDPKLMTDPDCRTKAILKTELVSSTDAAEVIRVHSYGFAARERTTTYRMRGGDGNYHDVDVDWTEYIPRTKTVTISIEAADQNAEGDAASGSVCFHGLTAKIMESSLEVSQ